MNPEENLGGRIKGAAIDQRQKEWPERPAWKE
jgi:hypothetical protein